MKHKLLTLSVVAALTACGGNDEEKTVAPAAPEFAGEFYTVATKLAVTGNPSGQVVITDANPDESLFYPLDTTQTPVTPQTPVVQGKYGDFFFNAAGEYTYTLWRGNEDSDTPEHPDVTALVKAGMPDLIETFYVTTADGTQKEFNVYIRGIDEPATFGGNISSGLVQRDTGKGDASGTLTVADANPEEAHFKPVLEQPSAVAGDVDGTAKIITTYGEVTIKVIDPVVAVEADPDNGIAAVKAVAGKLEWAYDLDEMNQDVIDLLDSTVSLEDTFTVQSADGTEQMVTVLVKGSDPVAADINGAPGGIDEEPAEGEDPVVNDVAEVNINASNAEGTLSIIDPNYAEEAFQEQVAVATLYGTFSIDAAGKWTYVLDTTNADVVALKGDGTAPDPLFDEAEVQSVDGTTESIKVQINGLVGGNLAAQVGDSSVVDGVFRIKMPSTLAQGKATFKVNYPAAGNKDAKIVFYGRAYNGDTKRTMAAISIKDGAIKLMNGRGTKANFTLDQTYTPGEWFDVAFTWNTTQRGPNGYPLISLSIDDTPVTSAGGEISGEYFESFSIAKFIVDIGSYAMEFYSKGDSNAPLYVDDVAIYSDVSGTTSALPGDLPENFDDLAEGAPISVSYTDSATKTVLIAPIAKPEAP